MKKSDYNPALLIILLLSLVSFTLSAQEVTKKFHKEYQATKNTTLEISNRYGDVVIQSWEKEMVVIDVVITVELTDREKAEKLLGYIDVMFSEGDNRISAKTVIDDKFNFTGWGSTSKRFSIDYNVMMPAKSALILANKYGNADLDKMDGLVNLDIRYGNLSAGSLTRGNEKPLSKLSLSYGKGTIDETGWLDLTLRYCGNMEISKSKALLLDSKYSKISLDETSSVVGQSKYDNISIQNINNLVLENGYTEVDIGALTKKLDFRGSYGSFEINHIPADFQSLNLETRYMGVKLGIESSASYNLDAKVSYGGLKYNEENFKSEIRIIENNSKEVKGTVGKEEANIPTIRVISSYGSVKLY